MIEEPNQIEKAFIEGNTTECLALINQEFQKHRNFQQV